MAKRLGVNRCIITQWEKNHASPRVYLIPRAIEFLGYTPLDPAPKTQGEMIVRFRNSKGMGVRALARALGIAPSTLWSWEKERTWPNGEVLERIRKSEMWREGLGQVLEADERN